MTRFSVPISDSVVERLLAIDGVNGVGEGFENGKRVIVVSVEDQQTANDSRIPENIEGFPVFVEVVGGVGLASAGIPLAPDDRPRNDLPQPVSAQFASPRRPVPPGVSIGHYNISAGTSSFLATDGNTLYQMGNSHVLALYGNSQTGDEILQPGPVDGGERGEDRVGRLAGDIPVEQEDNAVDLAWYKPETELTTVIEGVGEPSSDPAEPQPGDEVIFVGRTSGITEATVDRVNFTIKVGPKKRVFVNQFRLNKPLIPGDSGAPIVRKEDDGSITPLGIGFASTENHGFANPISSVTEASGLSIVMPTAGGDGGTGDSPDGATGGGGVNRSGMLLLAGVAGVALLSKPE